jgi:hypothetical protein
MRIPTNRWVSGGAVVGGLLYVATLLGCGGNPAANPGVFGSYTSPDGQQHYVYATWSTTPAMDPVPCDPTGHVACDVRIRVYGKDDCTSQDIDPSTPGLSLAINLKGNPQTADLTLPTKQYVVKMHWTGQTSVDPASIPTPRVCDTINGTSSNVNSVGQAAGAVANVDWTYTDRLASTTTKGTSPGEIGVVAFD